MSNEDKQDGKPPEQPKKPERPAKPAKPKRAEQPPSDRQPPAPRGRATTVVAWIALVIAAIAFAGGLYLEKEREKLKDRIHDVRLELRDTEQALSRRDSEFASRDALARIEGETSRRLLESERRYDELAASVEYLRTQTDGARAAWIQAELEHVLRLAWRHLEVERDPRAALIALRAVEQRLGGLSAPGYGAVLEQVTQDIAALEAVRVPDIEAIVMRIDGLGNTLADLPIMYPEGVRPTQPGRAREPGFAGIDWRRKWRRIRESFRDMITIRREGRPAQVLLSPDQEYFVRMSAQLKLESARVAAVRRAPALYRSSLRNTRGWIESWYDTDDATVQAMVDELRTLERQELDPALPDLGGALRLLRAAGDRQGSR